MWTRTQDKTILKDVKEFCVKHNYDVLLETSVSLKTSPFKRVQKEECYIEGDCIVLGTYSNEEKALKVLDMIAEHTASRYPFYMPQDVELE